MKRRVIFMTIKEKLNEDEETLVIGVSAFTASILDKILGRPINDVEFRGIKSLAVSWLNSEYTGPENNDNVVQMRPASEDAKTDNTDKEDSDDGK